MDGNETIHAVQKREEMYYSFDPVSVSEVIEIPDVYEKTRSYERMGLVKIIRYEEMPKEKLALLHNYILEQILRNRLIFQPDHPYAQLYARYFPKLWDEARRS